VTAQHSLSCCTPQLLNQPEIIELLILYTLKLGIAAHTYFAILHHAFSSRALQQTVMHRTKPQLQQTRLPLQVFREPFM
jgi:hypothetical protein